ncbi:unnamed protein product, partial [Adineta steineri]
MIFRAEKVVRLIAILIVIALLYFLIIFYYPDESSTENDIDYSMIETESNDTIIHTAVVLSLAKDTAHIAEFHLLYDSWRFIQNFSPLSQQVLIDLIV